MSHGRSVLTIARLGLLRLSRDRVALFFTFALPLMIITLLAAAVPGGEVAVGVVAEDDGPLARELVADLEGADSVELRSFGTVEGLERAVRLEAVQGGVVVPAGYDAALREGRPMAVTLIVDPTAQDAAPLRSTVAAAVANQAAVVQAARFAAGAGAGSFDRGLEAASQLAGTAGGLEVKTTIAGKPGIAGLGAADYATVGELVLFIFLIGLTSAGDLVEARRDGTARRMLATPTPAWAVVVGEGLGRYAILLLQATFIVLLGATVFGVSWGNPLGVALIVAAFALVATSISLLVGTLARSNEQATSLGPPVGIALAMLGGAMWPLEIVGPVMRTVGHLTPHAWALDGFVDLMGNGAPATAILPQLAVLALFTAVLLPLAGFRLRRAIGA
jgi:ABC-2 type transport system permease protein